jgi:hypothetical protein
MNEGAPGGSASSAKPDRAGRDRGGRGMALYGTLYKESAA